MAGKYRVIIADDEPKILQLIKILGHWEEYGIEIVDECHDGTQALESIRDNRPDFVLSDIKMPDLDGLELIEETRRAGVDSLFILISGYRHFEYARSAIALNVVDYLLKPIEEERLNKTLEKVCRQIDQMREEKEDREELKQMRTKRQQMQMEAFWEDLLYKDQDVFRYQTEEDCNGAYQTEFEPGCYRVVCLVTTLNAILENAESFFSDEMTRGMYRCFEGKARYYFHYDLYGCVIVLNYPPKGHGKVREAIDALYYGIRSLNEVYGSFRVNIGVSTEKTGCRDLHAAFQEALAAEWGRLVIMQNGVLDYTQVGSLPRVETERIVSASELKKIGDCVKYLGREELGELFSLLYRRSASLGNCYPGSMADAFYLILKKVVDNVPEENRQQVEKNAYFAYLEAHNFQQVMKNLYLKLEEYLQEEEKKLKQKVGKPLGEAVRYIRANFAKAISAEEVAAVSRVSPAYLGKLFKEELGIGFSEFLTQVRLEEAERLLAGSNLSVKEIAGAVGYPDEKYFSKLFKKTTGIKPTEYRRIYG